MQTVLAKPPYQILAVLEDKLDNLVEDGLHLLVAAFPDGRQRHQPRVAVLPVGWRQTRGLVKRRRRTLGKSSFLDLRLCSI